MKKIILIVLSVYFISIVNVSQLNAAIEKKYDVPFEITKSLEYYYEDNDLIVLGNHSSLNKAMIKNYLLSEKKIFIYDYYLQDNIGADGIIANSSALYYSKNSLNKVDSLEYITENFYEFKKEVIRFFAEKNEYSINTVTVKSEKQSFKLLYDNSFRVVNKPYGYIDVLYTVRKNRFDDKKSLYILEATASFTPGYIALDNDDSSYGKWYNKFGYFHVEAIQAINEIDQYTIREGGTPIYKDAYPVNQPGKITISSTFSIGATLGYSFTNGFSLDDIHQEENKNYGLNISYSYSKAYTQTEPALSTQISSKSSNAYQWSYTYHDIRKETNHLNIGYLYEMNNDQNLYEGDVVLKFDYKMTVKNKNIFSSTKSFSGQQVYNYY